MTIEKDIDYHLPRYKRKTKIEKSRYAYRTLDRLDQVNEELKEYPSIYEKKEKLDDIKNFSHFEFIPPTIRKIVKHYCDNNITRNEALTIIKNLKIQALEYFLEKGFDPKLASDEEKEYEKRQNKALARDLLKHEEVFKGLDDLVKELRKIAKS